MPIPKPGAGEKESDFISRCMSDSVMKREYPDQKQRTAVCYQSWRDRNKKKSSRAANDLCAETWAMEPVRLEAFFASLAEFDLKSISPPAGPKTLEPGYAVEKGTALIPINGVILKGSSWILEAFGMEYANTQQISTDLAAAIADESVQRIMLEISSPGGTVAGIQELADQIYDARAQKPLRAHISDLGASAAYWLASQAETVTANRAAQVGSIGVYRVVRDMSEAAARAGIKVHVISSGKFKGGGVEGAAISEEQIGAEHAIVEGVAGQFVADIARGRTANQEQIQKLATGRIWLADTAKRRGLIDKIANQQTALLQFKGAAAMGRDEDTIFDMTPEAFEGKHPEAVKAWKEDAAKAATETAQDAERQRFAHLSEAYPDHAAFVAECFKAGDGLDEAKVKYADILTVENQKLREEKAQLEKAKAEAEKAVAFQATDGQTPAPVEPKPDLTPEGQAKKEWAEDEALRGEFADEAQYLAFRVAELKGKVRMIRNV